MAQSQFKLSVKHNLGADLQKMAEMVPIAASAALNRTIRSARTEISREIRTVYNIKAADVSNAIAIKQATKTDLTATLYVKGKSLALKLFSPRQTGTGVSIEIKRGNRKTLRSTFLAIMPSGHQGVFERKTKKRLPIKELFTIGLPQMFSSKVMSEKLIAFFKEKFPPEFIRTVIAFKEIGKI